MKNNLGITACRVLTATVTIAAAFASRRIQSLITKCSVASSPRAFFSELPFSIACTSTGRGRRASSVTKESAMANTLLWCNRLDVLEAFWIVGQEIRNKCHLHAEDGLSQAQALELAARIREQRELIRQLAGCHDTRHARKLVRLNRRLRRQVLRVVERAGLAKELLAFR